jgi:hypothetical protein
MDTAIQAKAVPLKRRLTAQGASTSGPWSSALLPAHVQPRVDELLSSWLVRLADAHGLKVHTFTSKLWPGDRIWHSDVDRSAPPWLLDSLARWTSTSPEVAAGTSLRGFEGVVFPDISWPRTPWILPLARRARIHTHAGLQYCPHCLSLQDGAYYRRVWRLGFLTSCAEHNCRLQDRCPQCRAPINFQRQQTGDRRSVPRAALDRCTTCSADLKAAPSIPITDDPDASLLRKQVTAALRGDSVVVGSYTLASLQFFDVLRRLMRLVATGAVSAAIRARIRRADGPTARAPRFPTAHRGVEWLDVNDRARLLSIAAWLLTDWPSRLQRVTDVSGYYPSREDRGAYTSALLLARFTAIGTATSKRLRHASAPTRRDLRCRPVT